MMTVDAPHTRKAFGARLKDERERRGTSLAAISDATKVNPSLLEALERGDASRWPKGLYRRSFFRDYLGAIGLPAEPYVGEFLELFPDSDEPPPHVATARTPPPAMTGDGPARSAGPLRLTFEDRASGKWAARVGIRAEPAAGTLGRRALAGVADLLLVGAIAGLASLAPAISFWPALAIVACAYFSLATLLLSRSPATRAVVGYHPSASGSNPADERLPRLPFWRDLRLPGGTLAARGAALRSYLMKTSRFAPSREGPLQRDLAEVRRHRLEQAKRNTDEIEAIG